MKRVLFFCVMLCLLFSLPGVGVGCLAAPDPVGVDIWVEIQNGGKAVITPEGESPAPEKNSLEIQENQPPAAFHMEYAQEGTYTYTIKVEPDGRENIQYDTAVYIVKVNVTQGDAGLVPAVDLYRNGEENKYTPPESQDGQTYKVVFVNTKTESVPTPTPSPVNPTPTPAPAGTTDPANPANPTDTSTSSGTGTSTSQNTSATSSSTSNTTSNTSTSTTKNSTTKNTTKTTGTTNKASNSTTSRTTSRTQPRTGDDSMLGRYLMISVLCSAGLIALSVYYVYTVKKEKQARTDRRD